jgi:riboflavin kinase / FMN adenylyltransferase
LAEPIEVHETPLIRGLLPKDFVFATDPMAPPEGLAGAVVAVGNFDGVHRGHVAVIQRAEALAERLGRRFAVLTFEPHPSDVFFGANTIFRLTPRDSKAVALARAGVSGMIVLTFDKALAALPAEDFVREILVKRLAVGAVVAGYDFHFGKGRLGTPDFLRDAGKRHGFVVEIVDRIAADSSGSIEPASSTATRGALEKGDVARAAHLLGHPYSVLGEVIHGEAIGRKLGFPTANLRLDPSARLHFGIYAVEVRVDGKLYGGVASYGRRPTFDNGAPLLETFLFDFSGNLYGKIIEVAFIDFIRNEEKFASIDALKEQIARDEEAARAILKHPSVP